MKLTLGRPNGDGKASSSSSESCHYSSNQVGRLPTNGQGSVLDSDQHAVGQWLQFLQMEMYLQGFFDNGYDDFETIKQVTIATNLFFHDDSPKKLDCFINENNFLLLLNDLAF